MAKETWKDNNLEEIIKSQGRKKTWVADKAKVSRNTITSLCKGADPHLGEAYRIANVLGKSVYGIWPNFPWPPEESK
jgi:DNA-binding XRE family transcriptional regulator